jgi:signal transduction histidine kinase
MADPGQSPVEEREDQLSRERLMERMRSSEEALMGRPSMSIRFRLVVGFLLCFFLSGAIAIATVVILYQVQFKLQFLETTQSLTYNVQQARRYEKNYFLYGTDLENALLEAESAESLLASEKGNILEVAGRTSLSSLSRHMEQYRALLTQAEKRERTKSWSPGEKAQMETALREHGGRIIQLVSNLMVKERSSVNRMIKVSQVVPVVFLGLLLLLIIYIVNFLARAIVGPLKRFQDYTRRIAEGNFSPIAPARKYRDEFSDLALALNRMLIELKIHEDTCIEAAKMAAVGTLTSGVAHELNNPLNNVAITTEALMEEFKTLSDDEKWKLLQDIYFENERASETVKSLLDFTRSEKPDMSPLDLAEVLQATTRLVQNEMAINNATLAMEIDPDLPRVMGAFNQLRQALLNLLINGIQAMPDGGTIAVKAFERAPDTVCVEIRDEGAGIPEDVLPHIFEPFFTTKEPGRGTGLGLSVCHSILNKHGGDLQVESEPGKGATFRILLPALGREQDVRSE